MCRVEAGLLISGGRLDAMTTALDSLSQCSTTLWVQNLFLTPSLTLLCPSFMPFPRVLSLSLESRAQCLTLYYPCEEAVGCHEVSRIHNVVYAFCINVYTHRQYGVGTTLLVSQSF